jgi:hypothetical protein
MRWHLMAPVVAVAMLFCMVGSVAADANYACSDNSCTFTVPDSYSVASNDPTQIIFSDSVSGGAFSVATRDASQFSSLDDATRFEMTQATNSKDFQPGPDPQSLLLAGNAANSFSYSFTNNNGTAVKAGVFVSVYQGKEYLLIFVTTPDQEDAFVSGAQPVFSSWAFT